MGRLDELRSRLDRLQNGFERRGFPFQGIEGDRIENDESQGVCLLGQLVLKKPLHQWVGSQTFGRADQKSVVLRFIREAEDRVGRRARLGLNDRRLMGQCPSLQDVVGCLFQTDHIASPFVSGVSSGD